jgi:hypothetical protein
MLQVRERNTEDGRWWSPDRDITVVFPRAIRATFYDLGEAIEGSVLETQIRLGVTREEIRQSAAAYGKLVTCVLAREDLREHIKRMDFRSHRAQAVVGLVFLDQMTQLFASKYGETLHKAEHDPNHEDMKECLEVMESFARPSRSWWRRLCLRVRFVWKVLRHPL